MKSIIPSEKILTIIYLIRDRKVMVDRDLAELYKVVTRRLNEQVKRNADRFPDDFMFQLTREEFDNLKSQIAISSLGGVRKLPYAFMEHGVAMLSSVLNSDKAIQVNIQIVKVFISLRKTIITTKEIQKELQSLKRKINKHDEEIDVLFEAIERLLNPKVKPSKEIGFKVEKED